jgi:uncharacterized protein (DUF1501 family)
MSSPHDPPSCCGPSRTPTRGARAWSRRELLLRAATTAGAAALAPSLLNLLCRHALAVQATPQAARKHLILLWLEGGPSQIDTFDPKPGAPTNGPYKTLDTEVPGWRTGEHVPGIARRAPHLSVIRTLTSKEGSHARARDLLHCGYTPNSAVAFPTLGAIVAHEIGDLDHDLPAFIQVSGPPGTGGYLGVESAPFLVEDASGKIKNLSYRFGVDAARMDRREELRALLDASFASIGGADAVHAEQAQRRRARRLMDSSLRSAFELKAEPAAKREAYGKGSFGQGVLLARRLVEHGVTTVEVTLEGWDTHVDNFHRTQKLCAELDPAFSALIDDLRERDLYDRTIVLCMGEFGRTPTIASGDGRNHWTNNFCVVLGGGGIKPGVVVGETDERGETTVKRPVQVADLFATLAAALGIDGKKEFQTRNRPVKLVDPNGQPVPELLA